jgi:flavin-dependent dehydrogenase
MAILPNVCIIGGGLAGLCAALHLSRAGLSVRVLEKGSYPRHKVCGEYISNEVLPYLASLGIDPFEYGAVRISRFTLSTVKGKEIESKLPLGGFGISRYTLDNMLYKAVVESGGIVELENVAGITFSDQRFHISTQNGNSYTAEIVIGAHGKRSTIDKKLERSFIQRNSPFLGVKAHYEGGFPDDLVALHNFKGGYCGVSRVENGFVNICYLASFESFKRYKQLDTYEQAVVRQNPHLNTIFNEMSPVFEKPLTISQISFMPKARVERHILMAGDAAGMIHPLCGNGMGMAIGSAEMLSNLILQYCDGSIRSREELEQAYQKQWHRTFGKRLKAGQIFSTLFNSDYLLEYSMNALAVFPQLLPFFIRQTHGELS